MTRRRAAEPPRLPLPEPGRDATPGRPACSGVAALPTGESRRRHLALVLPRLAVERLRVSGPVLVWRGMGSRREVVAAAGVEGVWPGQALSDARAVAPEARAVEADPAADAAFLERLALWAMRFSPLVALAGPDALVVDIAGAAHLFGGEAALLRRAVEGLARLGVTARGVVAGAPGAALALARSGLSGEVVPPGGEAAAVAGLGLSVLPLAPALVADLARLGLRRVGEARRQPRGPLARRFGAALLGVLDEAAGVTVAPLSPIRPPPDFAAAREFLDPPASREAIEAALGHLLRALCRRLEAAGRGARRVVLRAHRVDGAVQEVAVGTALATRDPAHLARLFAGRLERLEPGCGFERIALGAEVTEAMEGAQGGFVGGFVGGFAGGFAGGVPQAEELARLCDRLAQRVQVWRLAPASAHWPEHEVARVAPTASFAIPEGWPRAPRPPRLLRRPPEIGAMALLPDAPPSLLRIGRLAHRVRAAEGPERIAPAWWQEGPARRMRDYYRVELASGARLWVCRIGFGAEARWFLRGRG